MFLEARHQLDQVAGPVADIELGDENVVPAILHRPVLPGRAKR